MSAENIIALIKKDAEKDVKNIQKEAEKQAETIIHDSNEEAEKQAEKILKNGKEQSENLKKILVSKASQEVKRDVMKVKEEIIEDCFNKAFEKLVHLDEERYKELLKSLIEDGKRKIGDNCELIITGDIDKNIADDLNIKVSGKINASGGVLVKSSDGQVTLDNTFEGILKRKKGKIRIDVGKLLFS